MMARGFRSVGWVAAVGTAALACYMLSLQVATERAELASVERKIIATKQEIRSLQTELGTRGRLSQLERWNADVLALSAPASGQFLQSEFTLARFDQRERTIEEKTAVRLASLETQKQENAPALRRAVAEVREPLRPPQAVIHRASFQTPPAEVAAAKPVLIDDKLAREIGAAAHAETGRRTKAGQ
ncbi:hypothetical protein [Sphingosinicella rhizophila]|uniref:Cell division protein FtsL n=1 Tax=Sphingosinicella rhizophila TaxID=3050082 RepID=A0ABU3Q3P6_9SPHN|nr:hypothetical protein [Sphingosinicella sp. GR2756]MDT9598036.1 hypothetical protein [Sphingosinicella sp. GR2756]